MAIIRRSSLDLRLISPPLTTSRALSVLCFKTCALCVCTYIKYRKLFRALRLRLIMNYSQLLSSAERIGQSVGGQGEISFGDFGFEEPITAVAGRLVVPGTPPGAETDHPALGGGSASQRHPFRVDVESHGSSKGEGGRNRSATLPPVSRAKTTLPKPPVAGFGKVSSKRDSKTRKAVKTEASEAVREPKSTAFSFEGVRLMTKKERRSAKVHDHLKGVRIGEATNPGPGQRAGHSKVVNKGTGGKSKANDPGVLSFEDVEAQKREKGQTKFCTRFYRDGVCAVGCAFLHGRGLEARKQVLARDRVGRAILCSQMVDGKCSWEASHLGKLCVFDHRQKSTPPKAELTAALERDSEAIAGPTRFEAGTGVKTTGLGPSAAGAPSSSAPPTCAESSNSSDTVEICVSGLDQSSNGSRSIGVPSEVGDYVALDAPDDASPVDGGSALTIKPSADKKMREPPLFREFASSLGLAPVRSEALGREFKHLSTQGLDCLDMSEIFSFDELSEFSFGLGALSAEIGKLRAFAEFVGEMDSRSEPLRKFCGAGWVGQDGKELFVPKLRDWRVCVSLQEGDRIEDSLDDERPYTHMHTNMAARAIKSELHICLTLLCRVVSEDLVVRRAFHCLDHPLHKVTNIETAKYKQQCFVSCPGAEFPFEGTLGTTSLVMVKTVAKAALLTAAVAVTAAGVGLTWPGGLLYLATAGGLGEGFFGPRTAEHRIDEMDSKSFSDYLSPEGLGNGVVRSLVVSIAQAHAFQVQASLAQDVNLLHLVCSGVANISRVNISGGDAAVPGTASFLNMIGSIYLVRRRRASGASRS